MGLEEARDLGLFVAEKLDNVSVENVAANRFGVKVEVSPGDCRTFCSFGEWINYVEAQEHNEQR